MNNFRTTRQGRDEVRRGFKRLELLCLTPLARRRGARLVPLCGGVHGSIRDCQLRPGFRDAHPLQGRQRAAVQVQRGSWSRAWLGYTGNTSRRTYTVVWWRARALSQPLGRGPSCSAQVALLHAQQAKGRVAPGRLPA